MRRRAFITLLGGAAATWPLAPPERGQPSELVHFCGRLTGRTGNRQSGESLCPT